MRQLWQVLRHPLDWVRWFGAGRCRCCGTLTLWLLRSEGAHEACWLEEK